MDTSDRFKIDWEHRMVLVDGSPVRLGARAFEIACGLVEARGATLSRDEIMAQVWGRVVVEPNTLEVHISAIRKAFAPYQIALETERGRGYRLCSLSSTKSHLTALPLIGRDVAMATLNSAIKTVPLVTVTGAVGVGKSALVQAWMASIRNAGEWRYIDLDRSDVGEIGTRKGPVFARAHPLPESLVLDNVGDEAEAVANEVAQILLENPRQRVVTTSTEPLGVDGERVLKLPPLDAASIHDGEIPQSIALFDAMVRRGEERVPDDSSHLAARICTYVGGLPLAIEIAAHVALAHGYEQTLGMLEEGEVLSLRQEVSPARHRTLAAAISLAWQRLSGSEQEMLTKLAKAEALVPFDDAVANAGGRGSVESSTAAMIADLVSKSFLERIERGESLLWMLPSIRSFVRTATASERFAGPR